MLEKFYDSDNRRDCIKNKNHNNTITSLTTPALMLQMITTAVVANVATHH